MSSEKLINIEEVGQPFKLLRTEEEILQAIEDQKSDAPRVTPQDIEMKIRKVEFMVLDNLTTICQITVENGFTTVGKSACVSAARWDKKIGEDVAYKDAFDQLWPLEGYLLKEKLWQEKCDNSVIKTQEFKPVNWKNEIKLDTIEDFLVNPKGKNVETYPIKRRYHEVASIYPPGAWVKGSDLPGANQGISEVFVGDAGDLQPFSFLECTDFDHYAPPSQEEIEEALKIQNDDPVLKNFSGE